MQIGDATTYGNPGDSIAIKLADGTVINAIAGNVVNSSKVLIVNGYAFSETSPQVELTRTDIFTTKGKTIYPQANPCDLFFLSLWRYENTYGGFRVINFLEESWDYDSANDTIGNVCLNRGDGGGQYTDPLVCMADNRRPITDTIQTTSYRGADGNIYIIDLVNNRVEVFIIPLSLEEQFDPEDYDNPQWASYSLGEYTTTNPVFAVGRELNTTIRLDQFFYGATPHYHPETEFRVEFQLFTRNTDGIVGDREIQFTDQNGASGTITFKSYIDRPTDADNEYAIKSESFTDGIGFENPIFDNITEYSCSIESLPTISGGDFYVCKKELILSYQDLIDLGFEINWFVTYSLESFDTTNYVSLEKTKDFQDMNANLVFYRNVTYRRDSTRTDYTYYLGFHAPETNALQLAPAQTDLIQVFASQENRTLRYFLTNLGEKAYLVFQEGKRHNPNVNFEQRNWIKVKAIELEISETGIQIISENDYIEPESIDPIADNWQSPWSYAYLNSNSANEPCLDLYKGIEQYSTQIFFFKNSVLQPDKNLLFSLLTEDSIYPLFSDYDPATDNYSRYDYLKQLSGSAFFRGLAASSSDPFLSALGQAMIEIDYQVGQFKTSLLSQPETEFSLSIGTYSTDNNSCQTNQGNSQQVTLPQVTIPEGNNNDWVLLELAPYQICEG